MPESQPVTVFPKPSLNPKPGPSCFISPLPMVMPLANAREGEGCMVMPNVLVLANARDGEGGTPALVVKVTGPKRRYKNQRVCTNPKWPKSLTLNDP